MSKPNDKLYAYETNPQTDTPITAAPATRAWMDGTDRRSAYRCLPLVIANQAGWLIHSPESFTAIWDGGPLTQSLRIVFDAGMPNHLGPRAASQAIVTSVMVAQPQPTTATPTILSHFGYGIITFTIPYLFRTPPNVNLWVKGPANYFKDGVQALEGIVEADWSVATFTMNWKLTRPRHAVRFERGEPFCMIVPVQRALAESLDPVRLPMASNPEVAKQYQEWEMSRRGFLQKLPQETGAPWQKDYFKGDAPDGTKVEGHQTRLDLKEFRRGEDA
jgi:hypothetical protein